MESELHIPWTNDALERLVRDIINTGEAAKVDFKAQLSFATPGEKAELAKDIQSFANSQHHAYKNHAFLILGASPGRLSFTTFSQNADKLQATVDQIIRDHLGPFVPTHVRLFGQGVEQWGVIVVPPSRNAPHVFVRDTDKFKRGDVFVRAGTTTSKAEPGDFSRFYRVQLEDHTQELWEQLRELQRDIVELKKPKRAPSRDKESLRDAVSVVRPLPEFGLEAAEAETPNLLDSINNSLRRDTDPVSTSLVREAKTLRSFLDSKELPWDLNHLTKEKGQPVVEALNERCATLWQAIAALVENDETGRFDDALIEALSEIAFEPEAPAGTSYTQFGTGIRLYPLVTSLYIAFSVGLRKKRYKLLKRVMALSLSRRSYYDEPYPIGSSLFMVRRADEVFQTTREGYPNQRWCDAVGSYIQHWMSSSLYVTMPELERNKHFFYIGEFVLSLLGAVTPNIGHPTYGMFYFMSESQPIISRFLKTEGSNLVALFGNDLRKVLETFDAWGGKIALSSRCWGDGFRGGAVEAVFPEQKAAEK